MKVAKCVLCGRLELLEVAETEDWFLQDNFVEEVYGYYGLCPECKNDPKGLVKFMVT